MKGTARLTSVLLVIALSIIGSLTLWSIASPAPTSKAVKEEVYAPSVWNRLGRGPLNLELVDRRISYDGSLVVEEYYFDGAKLGDTRDRVYMVVLRPKKVEGKLPAVLMIHGYSGSHESLMPIGERLAVKGYAVGLIDAPGHGRSTGPSIEPEGIVPESGRFEDGLFYHVVDAAYRAVTVLESLPYVDGERIGVLGVSMGGITTLILAGVDGRIKAAVPIVAAGGLRNIFESGGLANFMVPWKVSLNSMIARDFMSKLDPLGVAGNIECPTLLMASTHDEFFPLEAYNRTYAEVGSKAKWLFIAANNSHSRPYRGWVEAAERFLDYHLAGIGSGLPAVKVERVEATPLGTLRVLVKVEGSASMAYVWWRPAVAGLTWSRVEAERVDYNLWIAEFTSWWPAPVEFYASAVSEDPATGEYVEAATTPVRLVQTAPIPTYLVTLLVAVTLALLARRVNVEDAAVKLTVWTLASLAWYAPAVSVTGRFNVSLPQLMERYGVSSGLIHTFPAIAVAASALLAVTLLLNLRRTAGILALAPVAYSGIFLCTLRSHGAPALPSISLLLALASAAILFRPPFPRGGDG